MVELTKGEAFTAVVNAGSAFEVVKGEVTDVVPPPGGFIAGKQYEVEYDANSGKFVAHPRPSRAVRRRNFADARKLGIETARKIIINT
jgi:hypothetical protein